MTGVAAIRKQLDSHGQSHLLGFYDQLDVSQQAALVEQIEGIDFDQLDELISDYILKRPQLQIGERIEPAPVVSARSSGPVEIEGARRRGRELIAAGKVAAFVVAGGQGTRLGYKGPKGCLEATPVAHKSLFQVFAEQIFATGRGVGGSIPWYVMTSPENDTAVRAFFRAHHYFGLPEQDVFFLVQDTMPAISFNGKVLLESKDQLALSPNGHGGCISALHSSGALDDMASRDVELISYFHVDNPLVRCIDPLFLGLHDLQAAQMSAKSLPKRDPFEPLGNLCLVDGKVTVIEYSDMPQEVATGTTEDGHLHFSAGSIGVHVLSRSFVQQLTADDRRRCLPYHRADKCVPFVDERGEVINPAEPNAVKLEMFVFDALPLADKTVLLETERSEEFSPIKNTSGQDSLPTSLHDQIRRAATWLEAAGVSVPRDADGQAAAAIEISPLFASTPEQLAQKIDREMVIATGDSVYLGERGQVGGNR